MIPDTFPPCDSHEWLALLQRTEVYTGADGGMHTRRHLKCQRCGKTTEEIDGEVINA